MEKSKVYFTDFRARPGYNLLQKLEKLIKTAGIGNIDFNNKYVAIKLHFGEPGNLAFLRPNYSKVVADVVKELGGKPFLTDCNTLYVGGRKNALDHIDAAYLNGFTPMSTGCNVIIADGLKGTDEEYVEINQKYVKTAKIGRAIMDADIVISLNHFKGHECTGFGGAIKNIGMGCGSRAGKMEMHSSGKPNVISSKCKKCKQCIKVCAHNAISYNEEGIAQIDHSKCVGCGRCIGRCNFDAVKSPNDEAGDILNKKMAEYALAVVKDRPQFHISLICDVSPNCDCHSENDAPIVPNIGMLASFDMVALDKACADLVNKQTAFENSALGENMRKFDKTYMDRLRGDRFNINHPDTNWISQITYGEEIGLGNSEYELIEMK